MRLRLRRPGSRLLMFLGMLGVLARGPESELITQFRSKVLQRGEFN